MILIKNAEVFNPKALGCLDVLVGGRTILAMEPGINPDHLPGEVTVFDATGHVLIPGFVDGHQHFTGGGGEGGFESRTPEMQLSMNIASGITTAVGMLGTDSLTRTVESLYAKTQAFNAEGITALMLTGSYWLPSPTVCGSVGRDLVYLEPVIGVKLAIADHRGPSFDAKELAALAAEVRVAALVSNKPGTITLHTGVGPDGLDLLFEAIDKHTLRPDMFIPTHINKENPKIRNQFLDLARRGAMIDATCLDEAPAGQNAGILAADMACWADENGLFEQISFSSDAGGSLPKWDRERKRIIGMGIGSPASLLFELKQLVENKGVSLDKALRPLTTTPARVYGLSGRKGEIKPGADADILVLDPDRFEIRDVIANGQVMMQEQQVIRKGYFE